MTAPARRRLGFFSGLTYPLRGMRFVFREHPSLVRIWITPVLLTLAAFVGLSWWLVQHHAAIVDWLWIAPSGDDLTARVLQGLHGVMELLASVLVFALGAIAILLLGNVIAAPFNEALSAQVERIRGRIPETPTTWGAFMSDVLRSVRIEAVKLIVYALWMVPLALLNLVLPVVGGPLLTSIGFALTVTYLAFDYTDWPAARRGLGLRERMALLRGHPLPLLGFGFSAWALLLLPGINLLLMPAAVAGGTLLYLDLAPDKGDEASAMSPVVREFPG